MKKFCFPAFMAFFTLAFSKLIAKYDFSGNANDLSGNDHNGTLMNAIGIKTVK